jgi:hypothetical protein
VTGTAKHICEIRDETAFRWFAWRMDVAVIHAMPLAMKSSFARELLDELTQFDQIDLAIADTRSMRAVLGRDVEQDDVAVFGEGRLVGYFSGPLHGLTSAQVWREILLPTSDPRRGQRRRAWMRQVVACAVNAVPADEPRAPQAPPPATDDPFVVLGVTRGSNQKAIRAAYRAKIAEYHPDLVERAGPELRKFAEDKTKRINAAYDALKDAAGSSGDRHPR